MIDIEEINKEIEKLENCNLTYNVINKLAMLYIVKDHYKNNTMKRETLSMTAPNLPLEK